MHEEHDHIPSHQLDRRSVVKAAAWSLPAVSLAAATPAYATSGDLLDLQFHWVMAPTGQRWMQSIGQHGNPTVPAVLTESETPEGYINKISLSSPTTLNNLIATIEVAALGRTVFRAFRGFGAHALRVGSQTGTLIEHTSYSEELHTLDPRLPDPTTPDPTTTVQPFGMTYRTTSTFMLPPLPAGGTMDLLPQWVLTALPADFAPMADQDDGFPTWWATLTMTLPGQVGDRSAIASLQARIPITH